MGVLSRVSCVTCAHAYVRERPRHLVSPGQARTPGLSFPPPRPITQNPAAATRPLRGPLFSVPGRSSGGPAVFPVPGMRKMSNPKVDVEGYLLNRPAFKRYGVWLRG